ncbi:translocation/assembly module TamB domain-containing protein [Desulfosediminicola ganghwensis]|uniref:translocation/assembly module TamB domain-containing protein n=1 Tax=Desulfosediminicola ganghwensis TaxID=2569540 RepID=UPI0010ACA7F8|nr:translocation/assembly module TamB domain-containing protein [Desulfosediminicola ganghwensis]
MKSVLRFTGALLLLIAALVFILGWSQPGLRLLARTAAGLTDGNVSYHAVYGTLASSWEVDNLKIHTPAAEIAIGSVKADWRPLEIFKNKLHVLSFRVQSVDVFLLEQEHVAEKEEQSREPVILPHLKLPIEVLLDSIKIEHARISSVSFPEIAYVEHLYLSLSGQEDTVRLSLLDLQAKGYSANLTGMLNTADGWQVELGGDATFSGYGVGPLAGTLHLAGPIEQLAAHVELNEPTRATVDGEITGLPNNFLWRADLDIERFQLENGHRILPEMMIGVKGPAHGDLKNYSGKLKGNLDYLFFDDVDFEIELSGNYDQIEFPYIHASNRKGEAELVEGLLSWDEELLWRGKLTLSDFDPSQLHQQFPGRIGLGLISSGSYTGEDGLQLLGDFSDIKGELRGFDLEGEGQIKVAQSTITLEGVNFTSDDAELQLEAMARMANGLDKPGESFEWQTDLSVKELNPSLFFADYPGSLSGSFTSNGIREQESLRGVVQVEQLEGVVRDYPVEGHGELLLTPDRLDIDNVILKSGTSELSLTGTAGEELDLSVNLESPDLSEFLVDLGGRVNLSGSVVGNRQQPDFSAKLLGSEIRYQELGVASVNAEIRGGVDPESVVSATVEAYGLQTGSPDSLVVEKIKLNLEGLVKQHELTGLLQVNEGLADFILSGGLSEEYEWAGDLQRFRVTGQNIGTWGQRGEAPLALSMDQALLDSLCVFAGKERICLSGMWEKENQSFSVDFGWQDMELSRLQPFLPVTDPVWGKSSADFSFRGNHGRFELGSGLMAIAKAGIGHRDEQTEDDWERTDLDNAVLRVNLAGDNLTAQIDAFFADQSKFRLDSEISNLGSLGKGLDELPLRGVVEADIRSLDFVAPLTDYRVRPSGSLSGTMDLSGTVAQPAITGKLDLTDGVVDVPSLGISLKDLKFTLSGAQNGVSLLAEAVSGAGWLKAQGDLGVGDGGVFGDFAFTGDSFDAVMLPEYAIQASPDLRLQFNEEGGHLSGKLHIPSAQVMPKNLKAAVSESGDVVFINGEEEQKAASWQFGISMLLTLGDEVKLSGYGLSGDLGGNLQIDMVPGSVMTGKGELSLEEGVFSIYGRSLDLVRSKLLFSGGPIDNPGIDARAEKVVSEGDATSEAVKVGVDVSGTVDNLEFVLYSDPPMDDTDILAYMVVGRSMSNTGQQDENLLSSAALALGLETSVGLVDRLTSLLPIDDMYIEGTTSEEMSLVVGKKLTDELYIGYDHNFFDQLGEWLLRYDLGKGFSVETRSSTEATGADILYSFER